MGNQRLAGSFLPPLLLHLVQLWKRMRKTNPTPQVSAILVQGKEQQRNCPVRSSGKGTWLVQTGAHGLPGR